MDSSPPVKTPQPVEWSPIPDFKAIDEDLLKRWTTVQQRQVAANRATKPRTSATTPPSPALQWKPNHEAILTALNDHCNGSLVSKDTALEQIYLFDLVLARLAVLVCSVRTVSSASDSDIVLTHAYCRGALRSHEEARPSLVAYSNALAAFTRIAENSGIDSAATISAVRRWHLQLLNLAKGIVAREEYEQQLAECENEVADNDTEGLAVIADGLSKLLDAQKLQQEELVSLWNTGLPEMVSLGSPSPGKSTGEAMSQRTKEEVRRFIVKIFAATSAGSALLAPMLIMVLHPGLVTALVTTTVFVFVVGVLMAVFMEGAEPKDIVGANAAYAAVLVVFVGTTGGGTSNPVDYGKVGGIVFGSIIATGLFMLAVVLVSAAVAWMFPRWITLPIPGGKELREGWLEAEEKTSQLPQ